MRSSFSFETGDSIRSSHPCTFGAGDNDFGAVEMEGGSRSGIVYGAMIPAFLKGLTQQVSNDDELIDVELQLDDHSIAVCSVFAVEDDRGSSSGAGVRFSRSLSSASNKLRQKLGWLRSASFRTSDSSASYSSETQQRPAISAMDALRIRCQLQRSSSTAQRALGGLRFISNTAAAAAGVGGCDADDATSMWRQVEARFDSLAKNGYLCREDFGECMGMVDSKEFAEGIFDALARRKRQRIKKITKEELYEFWQQLSDQSFDARLQIFFDMADSNEDGRITRDEVQELIMLSASANKLSTLKEKACEYANLIMEELDPDDLGYIELWQLEMLLLQRDVHKECSRPLSIASGRAQSLNTSRPKDRVVQRIGRSLECLILENWQRGWILLLWLTVMASLFAWKFIQYRNREAFKVMGYCLCTAKGAAETLKLNMALILLPVCRNTLTWLRSTRASLFVPFDDNLNFHKIIACAIVVGVMLHAGNHMACDFPRLVKASPETFAFLASDFNNKQPTYGYLYTGIEGVTGIVMVLLMIISFTLATSRFRRNVVRLPAPFNRLEGYNAFWYSHHLLALVYLLLLVHGTFLFLVKKWYKKTTWMYISVPLILYAAERSLRICRSESYAVKILKVTELPGNVFNIVMAKPQGFTFKSGQYIFLQCPTISKFEWHPFSITSAPGDNYLNVHIRIAGDWTQGLKKLIIEGRDSSSAIGRIKFDKHGNMDNEKESSRLLVDGPYGAPAQDYKNYDVLLLIGLGIGATPYISILRDLLNSKRADDSMDSTTEASTSDDSLNSFASSSTTQGGKRKATRVKSVHFCWVTRESGSFEWFKGVMDEVAEMDHKGLIEMHNYLTSVYEESDARSALITMVQALNHAKYGVDILSGTRVKTHFARPNWKEVFAKIAKKHPYSRVGVFYCGKATLAKELKKLSHEMSHESATRFEFHKEHF